MTQTPERRNDIGYKATLTIYTSVIAVLLGLFVHAAWSSANEGNLRSQKNEIKIATVEECIRNMSQNVAEIKDILKVKYQ